jgi:hypothetical protein
MSHSSVNPSGRVYILERDELVAAWQRDWILRRLGTRTLFAIAS